MKPRLVLLPGMMCDERLFASLISRFQDRFNIATADLTREQTIADMARGTLSEFEGPLHLLGLSMGGIVAMEAACQAPERIDSLILLDTNARADSPLNAPVRDAQINAVRNGELARIMKEELKPRYVFDPGQNEAVLKTCMDMALDLGNQAFVNQSIALKGRSCLLKSLINIECPTLVACGENDALCPLNLHEEIADKVGRSTLRTIKKSGHLPTLERPQATNQIIEEFFNGFQPQNPGSGTK